VSLDINWNYEYSDFVHINNLIYLMAIISKKHQKYKVLPIINVNNSMILHQRRSILDVNGSNFVQSLCGEQQARVGKVNMLPKP